MHQDNIHIIMYHYVREIKNSNLPEIKGLEISSFKRQLDFLQNNFNFITAEDLINNLINKMPLPKSACLLTFDDGLKDHYKYVLPELMKKKITGLFFPSSKPVLENKLLDVHAIHLILAAYKNHIDLVNDLRKISLSYGIKEEEWNMLWKKNAIKTTSRDSKEVVFIKRTFQRDIPTNKSSLIIKAILSAKFDSSEEDLAKELYLSKDDIKTLVDEKMHIGSHGHSHSWLNTQSYDDQKKEILKSLDFLNFFGVSFKKWIMCYPYGAYNKDTTRILKDNNCVAAVIDGGGVAKINTKNRYTLQRYDTNEFPQ